MLVPAAAGAVTGAVRVAARGAAVGMVGAARAATLARGGAERRTGSSRVAAARSPFALALAFASTASALARRRARSASPDGTSGKDALAAGDAAPLRCRPLPSALFDGAALRPEFEDAEDAAEPTAGNATSGGMSARSTYWRVDFIAQPARTVTLITGSSMTTLERTRSREPPVRGSDSTVTETRPGSTRDAPCRTSASAQNPSPVSPSPNDTGIDRLSGRPISAAPWGCPRVKAAASSTKPSKNREVAKRLSCKMIVK